MFRSLTLIFVFAAAATVSTAAYRWVPGHGLTGKSGGSESVAQLINMCKDANGVRLPWMRIIEKEYKWDSLELNKNDYGTSTPLNTSDGIDQIVNDAVLCKDAGMFLRVMIMHKYTDYPAYMATEDMYTQIGIDGNGNPTYNIKLDKNSPVGGTPLDRLKLLYKAVITALQSNANAKAGFYGFVLQETTIGGGGAYYGEDGDGNATHESRRAEWFNNLRKFHDWLASDSQLGQFDPNTSAPYRGRLFWQMINTPDGGATGIGDEISAIIDYRRRVGAPNRYKGMGLCGPDTFPREPSNGGAGATTVLFRSYETMREWRDEMPISLHVYAGNYRHDRPHQNAAMIPGVVPLWKGGDTTAINGYDNWDAGDGLFNFLGCAGDIGTANWQIGDRPDHMDLHNVIWSTAEGDLAAYTAPTIDKNAAGVYIEAGPNMTPGHYGWSKVKTAMQAGDGKFVDNWVGGLNATAPFGAQ